MGCAYDITERTVKERWLLAHTLLIWEPSTRAACVHVCIVVATMCLHGSMHQCAACERGSCRGVQLPHAFHAPNDLGQAVLGWLRNLFDQAVSHWLRMLPHEGCHLVQQRCTLPQWGLGPLFPRRLGCLECCIDLLLRACLHLIFCIASSGVGHPYSLPAGGLKPLAGAVPLDRAIRGPQWGVKAFSHVRRCV